MGFKGLDLEGRVAVVLGGTSGIGMALTKGLAEAGASVVPSSRRKEQVEEAAAEVEKRGRKALRLQSDVTDRASLEAALKDTIAGLGPVDILVNCAGRTKRTPSLDVPEDEWQAILETNLTGTMRACQVFGRHMTGAGLRPHRQHRVPRLVRRPLRGRGLHREQGGGGRSHPRPRPRVGAARA